MKIKFILLIFFLNLCLASQLMAEDIFSWESCLNYALKNHPDLVASKEKVTEARSDKNIKAALKLPQIDFDLTGDRKQQTSGAKSNTFDYDFSLQQLVFDGFKTSNEVSSALKTYNAAQYNYALVSSNIRLNLRSAFVELLRAQEFIPITEAIEERQKQNYALVKLRYEAGREHRGSLLTAEAGMASTKYEAQQAKRDIILARRSLLKELGISEFKDIKLDDEFVLSDKYMEKPILEKIADTTPFLQELIAKKNAARFDLSSKKADFMPAVYINGSSGRTSNTWPPQDDNWSMGFSVSFPIFEGGSRIVEVTKAKAKLRRTEAEERSGRNTVLVTLEETWKDLQDSIDYVFVKKKFLDAAKERANIASAQYQTGLIFFDDWIIIENNFASAEKSYLDARSDMLISEAYWIQAIGGTLEYDKK